MDLGTERSHRGRHRRHQGHGTGHRRMPGRRRRAGGRPGPGRASARRDGGRLQRLGSPELLGLSVDVTEPRPGRRGLRRPAERWGSLNVLVNTLGPGAGRFEQLDDADWMHASSSG